MRYQTTIEEKFQLIQRPGLSNVAIKKLVGCGSDRAHRIRTEIANKIAPKPLPALIPTRLVIEHEEIDIDMIIYIATKRQQIAAQS